MALDDPEEQACGTRESPEEQEQHVLDSSQLVFGRLCSWPSMKEVGRGTLSMKGCHVDAACRVHDACRDAGVVHGILQDEWPWRDSYGLFGSGANPRKNTRCLQVDRSAMMPSEGKSLWR